MLALGAVAVLVLSSCSAVNTAAGPGLIYTNTIQGKTVTSNSLGNKVGTARSVGILGLVVTGDASIQAAANQAGIKKVSHVDQKSNSVLGLFTKNTIIVYGE